MAREEGRRPFETGHLRPLVIVSGAIRVEQLSEIRQVVHVEQRKRPVQDSGERVATGAFMEDTRGVGAWSHANTTAECHAECLAGRVFHVGEEGDRQERESDVSVEGV